MYVCMYVSKRLNETLKHKKKFLSKKPTQHETRNECVINVCFYENCFSKKNLHRLIIRCHSTLKDYLKNLELYNIFDRCQIAD